MNKLLKWSLFCLVIPITIQCSDKKKEGELTEKINQLEKELDHCKNGENKQIGIIKNSFEKKDFETTITTYNKLIKDFPSTSYLKEGEKLVSIAKQEISKKEELEKNLQAKELAKERASLTKLKKEYDDVEGITWYYQKYFTHYANVNRASIYMGQSNGASPSLRLKLSYTGDDWIFFETAFLSFDGDTKEIYFDKYKNKESDNNSDGVFEWIDVLVEDSEVLWFKKFANSKNAKMRLSGKYTKTRNLTPQERQGIIDVIAGYEYLKKN